MMVHASIPVDLHNPGQVFACLGFLEAADILSGNAEGGFDWSDETDVRFRLRADGDVDPFERVLGFLAAADVCRREPFGFEDAEGEISIANTFPARRGDRMALPIRLDAAGERLVDVGHWADGSSRNPFKLYAGNRSADKIAAAMIHGSRRTGTKRHAKGKVLRYGVALLWTERREELLDAPFDVLTEMGGSFNFDPRGGWTALDAGYSPNQHQHLSVAASPVVEILAAIGLEHARPDEYETRRVRYGVWGEIVAPMLARPALAGADTGIAVRSFRFGLELSGKNKIVTFAQEEISK